MERHEHIIAQESGEDLAAVWGVLLAELDWEPRFEGCSMARHVTITLQQRTSPTNTRSRHAP